MEFQPLRGGPDLVKAIVANQLQLGVSGATDVPVFRATGVPIRFVASEVDGNHFTLNVAPGITKVADLKGKSIGVTRVGATTWIFAAMLAKQQGWDPEKDVKIVGLGGLDAQLAALTRGEIAAYVWGDGGAVIELQGKSKILFRLDTVTPKWISQAIYASDEYIKGNKETIARTLKGFFQGTRFMLESTKEAAAIAAKTLKWPEEAVLRAHRDLGPPPLEGRRAEHRGDRHHADDPARVQGPGQARPHGRPVHERVHAGEALRQRPMTVAGLRPRSLPALLQAEGRRESRSTPRAGSSLRP